VSFPPGGPFWISSNGTGTIAVYNGQGVPFPGQNPIVVTVPPAQGKTAPSAPTGQIFNSFGAFPLTPSAMAVFIFATEDGTISGWSPQVDPTNAILKIDNSTTLAVYKGLAAANGPGGARLYAANFHAGTIDVFDSNFNQMASGAFTDGTLPMGFAPFNIQNIGGRLYVTYAKQDDQKHDDVSGQGNGYINVFDMDGNMIRRLVSAGPLNSPWGVTLAPPGFGVFENQLLVGNFGDGKINVFDPSTGAYMGQLQDGTGTSIQIDGLWTLVFGGGGNGGDPIALYFTAGTDREKHGLFGQINATQARKSPSQIPN
jgi:uncharacterized protein (TIGR03118 family)